MNKLDLGRFLDSKGQESAGALQSLIAELNDELLQALSPRLLDATEHRDYVSNWIYDKLCDLVAEADDILHLRETQCNNCYLARRCKSYKEDGACEFNVTALAAQLGTRTWDALVDFLITKMAKPELSVPMRKFVKSEPLNVHQRAITRAVRSFGNLKHKLAALELIRGAFQGDCGEECSLADARTIYDAIMEREVTIGCSGL